MFQFDMVADVFDLHSTNMAHFLLAVAVAVLHVEYQTLLCCKHFLTRLTWMPYILMEHFHMVV